MRFWASLAYLVSRLNAATFFWPTQALVLASASVPLQLGWHQKAS